MRVWSEYARYLSMSKGKLFIKRHSSKEREMVISSQILRWKNTHLWSHSIQQTSRECSQQQYRFHRTLRWSRKMRSFRNRVFKHWRIWDHYIISAALCTLYVASICPKRNIVLMPRWLLTFWSGQYDCRTISYKRLWRSQWTCNPK